MNERLIPGTVRVVAIAAALLMLTFLVVTRSQAAFTASTTNSSNGFSTGHVALSDDSAGSALFTANNLTPTAAVQQCITVTYTGSLTPAPVKLYASSSGTLATYLDVTIEQGTGGSFGNCAGFSAGSTLYTGTLSNLSSTNTNFATGLSTFTANANPTARTFRITVAVQNTNAAESQNASAAFTWETQA